MIGARLSHLHLLQFVPCYFRLGFNEHHLSHADSAFHPSPFDQAAIIFTTFSQNPLPAAWLALLSFAPLLISNNTGPVHIAAALDTPVVDLYALTNPQHTPWNTSHRTLYRDVPCLQVLL